LAASLVWANSVIFGSADHRLIVFVFCSSTLIYNLDRLLSLSSDYINSPARSKYVAKHILLITILVFICFIIIALQLEYFNFTFIAIVSGLLAFTLLYLMVFNKEMENIRYLLEFLDGKDFKVDNVKIRPLHFKGEPLLQIHISFLKPLLLAFVWATTTVILPVVHSGFQFSTGVFGLFLIRFIEYAINGVLFDYRDIHGDKKNHKSNVFLGSNPKNIFKYTILLSVINIGIVIVATYVRILPNLIISDMVIAVFYFFIIMYIHHNEKSRNKPASSVLSSPSYALMIDGILFLPVIFTLLI
jgi:hypothetical protein